MIGGNNWLDEKIYKEIMANAPICTVDVIFFNPSKDQVLLGKRNNQPLSGEYYSIGGRLEKNEEFLDCAVRQAKRELGIEIFPDQLIFGGVINEIWPNSKYSGVNYHTVNIYYGYLLNGDEKPVLDQQHSACHWLTVTDESLHPKLQEKIQNLVNKL